MTDREVAEFTKPVFVVTLRRQVIHRGTRTPGGIATLEADNIDTAEWFWVDSEAEAGRRGKRWCRRCFPQGGGSGA